MDSKPVDKYDMTIPTGPSTSPTLTSTTGIPANTGWSTGWTTTSSIPITPSPTVYYLTSLDRKEVKAMIKEAVAEMLAEMLGKDE